MRFSEKPQNHTDHVCRSDKIKRFIPLGRVNIATNYYFRDLRPKILGGSPAGIDRRVI